MATFAVKQADMQPIFFMQLNAAIGGECCYLLVHNIVESWAGLHCLPDPQLSQLEKLPVHVILNSRGKVCDYAVQLFFATTQPSRLRTYRNLYRVPRTRHWGTFRCAGGGGTCGAAHNFVTEYGLEVKMGEDGDLCYNSRL